MRKYTGCYQSITMSDGAEWGCNAEGEGLFHRRPDGTWCQDTGTGQTPAFSNPQHLRKWLTGRYIESGSGLRMVGSSGWQRVEG